MTDVASTKVRPPRISSASFQETVIQNWASWSVFWGLLRTRRTSQSKKAWTACSVPILHRMKHHLMLAKPSKIAKTLRGCHGSSGAATNCSPVRVSLVTLRSLFANGLGSPFA